MESTTEERHVGHWGGHGRVDGEFDQPRALVVAVTGNVFVLDRWNDRVQCFTHDGTFVRKWGTHGSRPGQFLSPTGLALGFRHGLSKPTLETLHAVPELRWFPPGLLPLCATYLGEECIYVADSGNHRIQAFSSEGMFLWEWSARRHDPHFRRVENCVVHPSGSIYVLGVNH